MAHIQQILGLSYNYIGSFSPSERQMQTSVGAENLAFLHSSLVTVCHPIIGKTNISGHSVNMAHSNVQNEYLVQAFVSTSSSAEDVFLKKKSGKRRVKPLVFARCLPGTQRIEWTNVRDVMNSLGGIDVLLPVFAHIDHPTFLDNNLCPSILELMAVLLQTSDDKSMQSAFLMMGYLLERVDPQHLSLDTVNTVCKLCTYRQSAEQSPLISQLFKRLSMRCLMANFRLWIFTAIHVQTRVLELLCLQVDEDILQYRNPETLGVQHLIDALKMYYWYTPPSPDEGFNAATDDIWIISPNRIKSISNNNGNVTTEIGRRPTLESLRTIRKSLWKIIDKLFLADLPNGIGENAQTESLDGAEVMALVSFLLTSTSDRERLEILDYILSILMSSNKARIQRLIRKFPRPGQSTNLYIFVWILGDTKLQSLEVRLKCLEVVSKVIEFCRLKGKWSDASLNPSFLPALVEILSKRLTSIENVDLSVYNRVLECILHKVATPSKILRSSIGAIGIHSLESAMPQNFSTAELLICNPEFIPLLMSLLRRANDVLQVRGVQNLKMLFAKPDNCDAVLAQYSCTSYFFPLLLDKMIALKSPLGYKDQKTQRESGSPDNSLSKVIIDALFGILCLLHLRSFQRSGEDGIRTEYIRSGTEVLRNTLVYFQIACHERSLNGMPIVWVFLEQLIHCLYRDCSLVKESIVSRFLPFVEENLLYPPAQQSGLKKIIARRDANECTMEEDINAIPTFTFFEVDDYGGLMMSPSLIYSAITLLSSFDQFSILSKRSNVEEYNLLRCYVSLLLTVAKEQTAICIDEYTTSCPESKAFYVLKCLMKLATTASNFDTDEVSQYLVLIISTLDSSIQKLDLAQQGRDKNKWHISMQKTLWGIIDIYYRSCSSEKFVEQAYTSSTISKICKANEDIVRQIQLKIIKWWPLWSICEQR